MGILMTPISRRYLCGVSPTLPQVAKREWGWNPDPGARDRSHCNRDVGKEDKKTALVILISEQLSVPRQVYLPADECWELALTLGPFQLKSGWPRKQALWRESQLTRWDPHFGSLALVRTNGHSGCWLPIPDRTGMEVKLYSVSRV